MGQSVQIQLNILRHSPKIKKFMRFLGTITTLVSCQTQWPLNGGSGDKNGTFLHISDLHYDPLYLEGASFDSQCHSIDFRVEAGKFGAPESGCDTPLDLIKNTFDFIDERIKDKLDFVFWTGDNARHDSDFRNPRTMSQIFEANVVITQLVTKVFKDLPIVPSIGNNDVYPHNTLAFEANNSILIFYQHIWRDMIPESDYAGFLIHGSFQRVLIPGKLLAFSVNTMYLSNSNTLVQDCTIDRPASSDIAGDIVLEWLENALVAARKEGMKVYITGHIPPNGRNYGLGCTTRMERLAFDFRDTIKAQFYGHLNLDLFFFPVKQKDFFTFSTLATSSSASWLHKYIKSIFKHYRHVQKLDNLPGPVFVGSSIVPTYNPGFRVYYNSLSPPHTGELLDYDQYFMDLSTWNEKSKKRRSKVPRYQIEYTFKESFGITAEYLTSEVWKSLAGIISSKTTSEETRKTRSKFKKHMFLGVNPVDQ